MTSSLDYMKSMLNLWRFPSSVWRKPSSIVRKGGFIRFHLLFHSLEFVNISQQKIIHALVGYLSGSANAWQSNMETLRWENVMSYHPHPQVQLHRNLQFSWTTIKMHLLQIFQSNIKWICLFWSSINLSLKKIRKSTCPHPEVTVGVSGQAYELCEDVSCTEKFR